MTAQTDIEGMLREHIGLDAQSLGSPAILAVVRFRMKQLGEESYERYWDRLSASKSELHHLVEEIVVPETWFFRDHVAFSTLGRWVVETWLPSHPHTTLRLLSAPCSTGEEAYSLAMCLLDAGVPADRFVVEALDISARVLDHAARGLYSKNAFRGDRLDYRDRHFSPAGERWRLHEDVRRLVHFRQGNLLDAGFGATLATQDVIFCRNLLIYLTPPAQRQILGLLERLLAADGLLFSGHAESFSFREFGFTPAGRETSFAFQKRGAPTEAAPPAPRQRRAVKVPPATPPPPPKPAGLASVVPLPRVLPAVAAPSPVTASPPADALTEARRLADAGQAQPALRLCQEHLRQHGASAPACFLAGLLLDALGRGPEAAEQYRKALFLEPDHPEALWQLALLLERLGEHAAARQFQQRARRARERRAA